MTATLRSGARELGRQALARRDRLAIVVAAVLAAAVLLAGAVIFYQATHRGKQVTAYFSEAIGVYQGSTVRVLGVPVGTVDSVQPEGTRVKVVMTINHGIAIPASADAVVIAPSVISDRYIQLTPAYTGGPQLPGNAIIPVSRTAVPVEVDQIYSSLAKLLDALGPHGANKHGALSQLIKTGAANLNGNATYLHAMITQFSGLFKTLGGSSGNLAATVSYLAQFTSMLKSNDGQVRLAEQQLAQVSTILASDRQDLAAVIRDLAVALGEVKNFIGTYRGLIQDNVSNLASITTVLVQERASLAEALDDAPLAVDNFVAAYDAANHTVDGRGDLLELIGGNGGTSASDTAYASSSLTYGSQPPGTVAVPSAYLDKLPPLPLPAVGTVYTTPQAMLARGAR